MRIEQKIEIRECQLDKAKESGNNFIKSLILQMY